MQNLKIRVNNADESKEIQDIFESKGFEKWSEWSESGSIGGFIWTDSDMAYCDNKIEFFEESPRKEITLAELRAMVNQMKGYLMPSRNYEYILTDAREAMEPHAEDWIEIPDGAEVATLDGKALYFWKPSENKTFVSDQWVTCGTDVCSFYDFTSDERVLVIWQRATHPEELPFIDDEPKYTDDEVKYMDENGQGRLQSLNEQYAEIEQVRQAINKSWGSAGSVSGGAKVRENNHYFIDVSDVDEVDFYEIAKRYNVTDPAIQHILKKCLAIGNRGHKDLGTDLKDILKTAKRALQINGFGE